MQCLYPIEDFTWSHASLLPLLCYCHPYYDHVDHLGHSDMNDAGSGITVSVWSEFSDYPIRWDRWDSKVLMMMMDCTEQEYILVTLFSL